MGANDNEVFMCLPDALLVGPQQKSFEELRVSDYIQSYTTTGKAPLPVPDLPADPAARAALGFPPLFQPSPVLKPPLDDSVLSDIQLWEPTRNAGEQLYSIVASSKYSSWSPEELRCHAYMKGNRTLPAHLLSHPSVLGSSQSSVPTVPTAPAAQLLLGVHSTFTGTVVGGEKFQSFNAADDKKDHSAEEHRVAYIFAGRELTSAEITAMQAANPIVAARPSVTANVGLGATPTSSPWTARPAAFRPF